MEALGSELNSLRASSWPPSIPWWAHTHRVVLIQAGDKARRRGRLRTSSDLYYWFWQSCDSSQRNQYQRGPWGWEGAELKASLGGSECSILSCQVPSVPQWGGNPAIRQRRPWGPAAATSIQLSHWSLFPWGERKKKDKASVKAFCSFLGKFTSLPSHFALTRMELFPGPLNEQQTWDHLTHLVLLMFWAVGYWLRSSKFLLLKTNLVLCCASTGLLQLLFLV